MTLNLLLSREYLQLSGDLGLLRQKVEALPKGSRIVVDEIHALIFDYEEDYFQRNSWIHSGDSFELGEPRGL